MQDGVAKSDVFVLFLTKGVFTRPYVQLEVAEALKLHKPFILIDEADERHGKYDFNTCAARRRQPRLCDIAAPAGCRDGARTPCNCNAQLQPAPVMHRGGEWARRAPTKHAGFACRKDCVRAYDPPLQVLEGLANYNFETIAEDLIFKHESISWERRDYKQAAGGLAPVHGNKTDHPGRGMCFSVKPRTCAGGDDRADQEEVLRVHGRA